MSLQQSQFEKLKVSLPTRKEEAWKYTSLTDYKNIPWNSGSQEENHLSHDQMQMLSKNLPSEFYNLVFVNGILNKTLSDDLTSQIVIQSVEANDLLIPSDHVEKNILNVALSCLKNKLNISISDNETFEKPLHIVFVQGTKSPQYFSEKVNLHIGKNSELSILTQTLSLDELTQSSLNLNLDLKISEKARVRFIQIENENSKSYNFTQTAIKMDNDSQLQIFTMMLGSLLSRQYFHLEFLGHGADASVLGLNALNLNQHVDHYTFIQHSIGGNQSRQLYKSILSDSSHSVFRGRVRIEKNAQKADSSQLNNNLLLTREAQADSIPQLEIYADDVKAGHGSTVGQLNKEEIFYFLSRGINQYQAVKMLSFGYAQELIYQFENKNIQDWLLKILNQKLDRMINYV